jgi:phosphoenolpyruvate synthase/pyruvate phosphate dikinase
MSRYVLDFHEIDQTLVALVGGKGANLGELSRIGGVSVPAGACVTTDAFRRIIEQVPSLDDRLESLSRLRANDHEEIRVLSAAMRAVVEEISIPDDVASEIAHALVRLGEHVAYAVRSSATAEDLPTASFAGQQDSYLNVIGPAAILQRVSSCWASLYSKRAVTYRLRNGFDHRKVGMAVVIQQMVFPQAAGVLFTADPVTGNRTVTSVDASFGLGEALVSGIVNADVYKVRNDEIVAKTVGAKRVAIHASKTGGTHEQAIDLERQTQPALNDAQVLRLARLGRRIEAHFGRPQDIEWCLVDDDLQIVQSRPITTLFPIPIAADGEKHVYISVGHQQMMTDAMKPLGLSMWQLITARPMSEAGGRLFVDVTRALSSPVSRAALLGLAGKSDPLLGDALRMVLERGDLIQQVPDDALAAPPLGAVPSSIETDPAIVADLIGRTQASNAAAKRDIRMKSGPALLDFILMDIQELKQVLFDPKSLQVIMAGMEVTSWLNEQVEAWLGEKNAAFVLTQSVPGNVTSEMGLALLDVADVIRPYPQVVEFLRHVEREDFLEELPEFDGGREAREAIQSWLDRYGMRGVGEIDITRSRWSERPTTLLPMLIGNIRNFEPGAGARRFELGRQAAAQAEQELLERLRALPDGERKADETKRMIDRVRTFAGYREYPKYGMVGRTFIYKQALMAEADRLLRAHVLREKEDIFYLSFQELRDVVRTNRVDEELIQRRKEEFDSYRALTPPRVLTSEGETVVGAYRRDNLPAGALIGSPVSAGTAEGRARVVLDIAKANLEAGDILVTRYTDPSWTPLFVSIAGLVTEVGGVMTHGAVIAREYGLPAIVGVENATHLIRDGQRIRVNGTDGYVEMLP